MNQWKLKKDKPETIQLAQILATLTDKVKANRWYKYCEHW